MKKYMMSEERRNDVRSTARLAYLHTCNRFLNPALSKPEIRRIATGETRATLAQGGKFNSVIGGLLLAVAMKFVEKLIDKWLEEELFTNKAVQKTPMKGEPGYVAEGK